MSTSALSGLSTSDVAGLRLKYGFNALPEAVPERFWQRLYRQFNNPLIGILIVALLIDIGVWFSEGAHGAPFESITILTILLANAFLERVAGVQVRSGLAKTQVHGYSPILGIA